MTRRTKKTRMMTEMIGMAKMSASNDQDESHGGDNWYDRKNFDDKNHGDN